MICFAGVCGAYDSKLLAHAAHTLAKSFFQVSRAFGIPQKNICISLVFVAHFLGHHYPLPPIGVGSIYLWMITVFYFIVFLATHCILFIVFLHVVGYCMQYSSFFYGVLFSLLFFAITLVLVWCVFCSCV